MTDGQTVAEVQSLERVGPILDGIVRSRSGEGVYIAKVTLEATFLCSCPSSRIHDRVCPHAKALLEGLDADELRDFIISSQTVPT